MAQQFSTHPSDPSAPHPATDDSTVKALTPPCEAMLLRVFLGDDDTFEDRPLYEQLILKARTLGLAGATVTRGVLAYGPATLTSEGRLKLSEDLPVVVDIVDHEERIRAFLSEVDTMLESSVVTLQKVTVLRYGRKRAP